MSNRLPRKKFLKLFDVLLQEEPRAGTRTGTIGHPYPGPVCANRKLKQEEKNSFNPLSAVHCNFYVLMAEVVEEEQEVLLVNLRACFVGFFYL
jgi:hypothetical protein